MSQDVSSEYEDSPTTENSPALNPRVARLLAFLAPGLSLWYAGRPVAAVLLNLGTILVVLLFIIAVALLGFFPLWPAIVLVLAWLMVCWASGSVAQRLIADGSPSRGLLHHPLFFALIALLTFLTPLALTLHFSARHLMTVVTINDTAMAPQLEAGDRLLVDRTGFRDQPPQRGDMVVARHPGDGSLQLRRVIGLPSEHIRLFGHAVAINDDLANYRQYDEDSTADGLWLEQWQDHRQLIRLEHGPRVEHALSEVTLEADQFFLLSDRRTILADEASPPQDSRDFGPVSVDAIEGRPLYITWSSEDHAQPRLARIGLSAE